ncbi:hypothetical protein KW785_00225 [Candidatus Parcubacteria bacterium]|nr:hypothetical protein [Candidatus Parcubacteria bacterium]
MPTTPTHSLIDALPERDQRRFTFMLEALFDLWKNNQSSIERPLFSRMLREVLRYVPAAYRTALGSLVHESDPCDKALVILLEEATRLGFIRFDADHDTIYLNSEMIVGLRTFLNQGKRFYLDILGPIRIGIKYYLREIALESRRDDT